MCSSGESQEERRHTHMCCTKVCTRSSTLFESHRDVAMNKKKTFNEHHDDDDDQDAKAETPSEDDKE
jgi:hypothetical protein